MENVTIKIIFPIIFIAAILIGLAIKWFISRMPKAKQQLWNSRSLIVLLVIIGIQAIDQISVAIRTETLPSWWLGITLIGFVYFLNRYFITIKKPSLVGRIRKLLGR